MHEKSRLTLEFPKIIERLAEHCAFSASRALALELLPSDELEIVRQRQAFTSEAKRLLDQRPEIGVRAARDIRASVGLAERGGILSPEQLIEVQVTMRSSTYLHRQLTRLDETYPLLHRMGADLPVRQDLDDRIEACIADDGSVRDSASPHLRDLRQQIRASQQRLQERLNGLVNEFRSALQDNLITMREGRYVLPVRAEARNQVKGIVHDQSSSGATVFIEPMVIVDMNNRLRELELDERREIERILADLSNAVAQQAPYCTAAVELLATLDLQFAKARYSQAIRGISPRLNDQGRLRIVEARHPLLTGKVVPLTFQLGDQFTMVVITGPNTGGKTVALKTVGLLALMAQAGLHLPADERSEMPIFHDVLADIGDEQSIEQSLSTFSSHLTRIIEILRLAGRGTLVLLDELGAGTDPSEGSALARAILLTLLEREASCVATTHYTELKAFAHDQAGATNASVEFNVETLSPTYRLSIGIPGRSNALAIAARLGLDGAVIERARGMLGTASLKMEDLLTEIQSDRQAAADERFHLSMERAAVERERDEALARAAELEAQRVEIERERVQILNEARAEARKQLHQLRSDIGRLRAESQRGGLTEAQLAQLRERIHATDGRLAPLAEPPRSVPVRRSHASTPAESSDEPAIDQVIGGAFQVGDPVRVISMNLRGELIGLPDSRGEAEVQLGMMKMRIRVDDLERLSRRKARALERVTLSLPKLEVRPAPEDRLDVRGMRVEEVLPTLDRYLDDAYMGGMRLVRILHGKGTGALRQAIREQLGRHPLVKSFSTPPEREGGEGITEVMLNQ